MIVGKRMSSPILTVSPKLPITEAITMMKQENIRHLVVMDKNKMVGLITQNELEKAMPSQATSLSIWEINYLIDSIKVENVMIRDVITATEDMPVEEAARIMADEKISCLPVVRGTEVVGIITEVDLFHLFLELLGARQKGVRFSAEIADTPGSIAQLTQAIFEAGGDIIACGTFKGDSPGIEEITIKVQCIDEKRLKEAILPVTLKVLDIRTV